jgi:hypothetical protein
VLSFGSHFPFLDLYLMGLQINDAIFQHIYCICVEVFFVMKYCFHEDVGGAAQVVSPPSH